MRNLYSYSFSFLSSLSTSRSHTLLVSPISFSLSLSLSHTHTPTFKYAHLRTWMYHVWAQTYFPQFSFYLSIFGDIIFFFFTLRWVSLSIYSFSVSCWCRCLTKPFKNNFLFSLIKTQNYWLVLKPSNSYLPTTRLVETRAKPAVCIKNLYGGMPLMLHSADLNY